MIGKIQRVRGVLHVTYVQYAPNAPIRREWCLEITSKEGRPPWEGAEIRFVKRDHWEILENGVPVGTLLTEGFRQYQDVRIPPPRLGRAKDTRWHEGRWQRLMAKGRWVDAPE